MKILICAGLKTGNIVNTVKRKYINGDVEIISKAYATNIPMIFDRGDNFDRAIILEEGLLAQDSLPESINASVRMLTQMVLSKCHSDTTIVWVVTNQENAERVCEETLELYHRSKILIRNKDEKLVASFFMNIISNTLDKVHPNLEFKATDMHVESEAISVFSEKGAQGALGQVTEVDATALDIIETQGVTGVSLDDILGIEGAVTEESLTTKDKGELELEERIRNEVREKVKLEFEERVREEAQIEFSLPDIKSKSTVDGVTFEETPIKEVEESSLEGYNQLFSLDIEPEEDFKEEESTEEEAQIEGVLSEYEGLFSKGDESEEVVGGVESETVLNCGNLPVIEDEQGEVLRGGTVEDGSNNQDTLFNQLDDSSIGDEIDESSFEYNESGSLQTTPSNYSQNEFYSDLVSEPINTQADSENAGESDLSENRAIRNEALLELFSDTNEVGFQSEEPIIAKKKGFFKGLFSGNKKSIVTTEDTLRNLFESYRGRGSTLVVTGPSSSGKTTVAANLAHIISSLGYPVLVVDFDTRGRGLSCITDYYYSGIHQIDSANASLKQALNSVYADLGKYVNVITPTLHTLGMGLAADIIEGDRLATRDRLVKFSNLHRMHYCVTIYDMPMDMSVDYGADLIVTAENVIITAEYSNYGALKLMTDLTNIESEEAEMVLFTRSQLCLNKVRNTKLKSVMGKVTHTTKDYLKCIDKEVYSLIGFVPDASFSDIRICGEIPYDERNDEMWYSHKLISDTADGWELYVNLLYSALLKKDK